jgi:hypothetical protein
MRSARPRAESNFNIVSYCKKSATSTSMGNKRQKMGDSYVINKSKELH